MEFEFWVNLIVIDTWEAQTKKAQDSIVSNCTHVTDDIYFMEGDEDFLVDDGVIFNLIDKGIVGTLGDKTEQQKIKILEEVFGKKPNELRFNSKKIYGVHI